MASPSKVAIIGGGIAGLTCAARLGQLGIKDVTVFDTGKHAVGGRCSSRIEILNGQTVVFDHAVQYFTASDQRFQKMVDYMQRDGGAKVWEGPVGHLQQGKFYPQKNSKKMYIGTNGMRSVAESLAKFCRVQRPGWVGSITWDYTARKWVVDKWGMFDYVVIAHNGKCAAKLTEQAGVPEIHRLCQTRFSSLVTQRENRMTLCSLFVLMVAFERSLQLQFQGAHVDDPNISWVANNTAKLRNGVPGKNAAFPSGKQYECWTIISTKAVGEQNKVPQEHIPPKVADRIGDLLLASFAEATGLKGKLPNVCLKKLQLWGAAVPINIFAGGSECVFDAAHQIGISSDWLVSPCVQGAAVSGLSMAEAISKHIKGDKSSTKLQPQFTPTSSESPIGSFP